jgi:IS4 transposase
MFSLFSRISPVSTINTIRFAAQSFIARNLHRKAYYGLSKQGYRFTNQTIKKIKDAPLGTEITINQYDTLPYKMQGQFSQIYWRNELVGYKKRT